jgi:hypothetical protein
MAKKPEDRFQTPADLVAALDELGGVKPESATRRTSTAVGVSDSTAEADNHQHAQVTAKIPRHTRPSAPAPTNSGQRVPLWIWIVGGLLLVGALCLVLH